MEPMKRKRIVGIDFSSGPYSEFLQQIVHLGRGRTSSYVCMANVHMTIEAYRNEGFARIVNGAEIVAPDGMPLAKAFGLLHGRRQDRVAGMDLIVDLIREAEKEGLAIFLCGSTMEVLEKITERIRRENPGLRIAGICSPPFGPITEEEEEKIIERINDSGANIVLVALGCPRQENWMAEKKGRINAVMVGLGGAFPVYAGLQSRAPKWMQECSLEWLHRLCREPRRLFKRYLVTNSLFLWLLTQEMLSNALSREEAKEQPEIKSDV